MSKPRQTITIGGVRVTPSALLTLVVAALLLYALQRCAGLPPAPPPASTSTAQAPESTATRAPTLALTPPATASAPTYSPTAPPTSATPESGTPTADDGLPTVRVADLPDEALDTLQLIAAGGPFPYRQDGAVFQNREGLLPAQSSGYYHEYTVVTPGSSDRGARRIVTGARSEVYYTDDHYASFRRLIP